MMVVIDGGREDEDLVIITHPPTHHSPNLLIKGVTRRELPDDGHSTRVQRLRVERGRRGALSPPMESHPASLRVIFI